MNDRMVCFMKAALVEAQKAEAIGEVPIGAVVVQGDRIVGTGYNRRETDKDPTAHAEIIALRDASKTLGGWRLTGCELYVTIEPCPMCAGAMVMARVKRLIYGAKDQKAGAVDTFFSIVSDERLNHQIEVVSGVLEEECSGKMSQFFKQLRQRSK